MNNKKLSLHSFFILVLFLVSQCFLAGCAHKKVNQPVTLNNLQSKRVALAEIKGAAESKEHVEVAVVNEIIEKGRFEIVDRTTVQDALVTYPAENDWHGLGKKVGADYVLGIRIVEFNVKERQGLDRVQEVDPVLTEESGESKPVVGTRYVKVKSYTGDVKLQCKFFDVSENKMVYEGMGTANEVVNSRDGALPGKMAFLEKLSARAMNDFFEKIPK